jgi:fimbrial isopeptide formation D2 family protein/LPXTG-motif cell wall-anchored protein
MSHRTLTWRRLLAGTGIAALSALMVVGTAGVASAEPLPPPSTITQDTANLHITKYVQPNAVGDMATGERQTGLSGRPLNGVEFTAKQVPGVDLTTNQGWVKAAAMTVATAQTATAAVTGTSITTGATDSDPINAPSGTANFPDLPIGLYLVTETNFPANVTPSAPFLVTLPMTDPTNLNAWMYDVYVYPKNAVTSAEKTVQDAAAVKLGDPMSFTIITDIPHAVNPDSTTNGGENDGAIDKYEITDDLDSKVDYASADVTVIGMTDSNVAPTLDAGTHYNVTLTTATLNGPEVAIRFTEAGRDVLANLWQDNLAAQVQVVLHTTVNAVGEIANTAVLYPNSVSTGVSTPSVITKWGGVTVEKQDADNHATKLAGATFQVYVTDSSSIQPDISEGSSDGPLTIGTTDYWATGTDGTVTIDGLRYSNWANGATVADGDDGYHQYWLVETKAPDGYELLPNPIAFTVTGPSTQVADGPAASDTVTIGNVKHNGGFPLPLTGGSGTAAFTVGGVVLLLLAGGGYLVAARRRRVQG